MVSCLFIFMSVCLATKGKRTRLVVKLYRGSSANLPVQDDDILVDDGPCCYLESIYLPLYVINKGKHGERVGWL